ncbi:MAG: hypothetical protein ACOYWZ_20875 [Bacillota bacterium]
MRQLTASEVIFLSKLLQLEAADLSVSKASLSLISDDQLKTVVQAGIASSQTRIKGLQQFISENNITTAGGGQ